MRERRLCLFVILQVSAHSDKRAFVNPERFGHPSLHWDDISGPPCDQPLRPLRSAPPYACPTYLAAFIIPCSLPKAEVEELYARGAKEAFESTEMHAISGAEILTEGGTSWFAARNLEATPSFQGSLELWKAHRLRGTI